MSILSKEKRVVSRRRRTWHDILVQVLKRAEKGEHKTKIMEAVGMSYSQLENYLNTLEESGFITEKSGVWKPTEKGLHVIEACEVCRRDVEKVP